MERHILICDICGNVQETHNLDEWAFIRRISPQICTGCWEKAVEYLISKTTRDRRDGHD